MRNSTILFIVAILVLGWFGAEVYTAQNICVTTCLDLSSLNAVEQAIAVIILPVLLVLAGVNARRKERRFPQPEDTATTTEDEEK